MMHTTSAWTINQEQTVQPTLSIQQLSKSFGTNTVIANVTLDVYPGEFVSIVGPSGVGKTTLLRCLSGLMEPTAGSVKVNGNLVTEPPKEIAMVSQDYSRSLLPWMSVEKNAALPLLARGMAKKDAFEVVNEALRDVGLSAAGKKYPWQLSGGMQQRVSIARGIAYRPDVLIMDEPFASVDAQTRLDLEDLIRGIHRQHSMTTVFVTHDIDESVYISDRVAILGGPPAHVKQVLDIDLGAERNQIETRSQPKFAEYRKQIISQIFTQNHPGTKAPTI
ncbi:MULTISPECIES: ABC transporter ATP-binding protein [unclassified Glutamicibacter]|uniref:ABC transporter ATP-binding protein n=1 Tax=unclassified Glutamicibacter TaxID=2627139 RepID=UPI003821D137